MPVTGWFGTGQGYFGFWQDPAIAELLARDLARIMAQPLMGVEEVRVG